MTTMIMKRMIKRLTASLKEMATVIKKDLKALKSMHRLRIVAYQEALLRLRS